MFLVVDDTSKNAFDQRVGFNCLLQVDGHQYGLRAGRSRSG